MELSQNAQEMVNFWKDSRNITFKGKLISPDGCMCAQGQVLYKKGGYTKEQLRGLNQFEADTEVARILDISISHSILLRRINDNHPGAPQEVLSNPEKYLGSNFEVVLEFWKTLDNLSKEQRKIVRQRYWALGYEARDAAWAAAWEAADAGGVAGADAANAAEGAAAAWAAAAVATLELIGNVENPVFLLLFNAPDVSGS
jgi:hypothetical protein